MTERVGMFLTVEHLGPRGERMEEALTDGYGWVESAHFPERTL